MTRSFFARNPSVLVFLAILALFTLLVTILSDAYGVSIACGDHWLPDLPGLHGKRAGADFPVCPCCKCVATAEIRACTERVATAGDDNHPHVIIYIAALIQLAEFDDHCR